MPVGFNQQPSDGTKHYRKYYKRELEKGTEMMPKLPFDEFEIKRGQSRGNKASLFSFSRPKTDETGNISTVKVVGKFKGKINMLNHEVLENFETVQAERLDLVIKMMREVYFLRTNEELDFDMEKLKTPEQR